MEETIWNGSFYELTMEFSVAIKLQDVVQTLNKAPHFSGFWRDRAAYHEEPELFSSYQLYGYISVDNNKASVFNFTYRRRRVIKLARYIHSTRCLF